MCHCAVHRSPQIVHTTTRQPNNNKYRRFSNNNKSDDFFGFYFTYPLFPPTAVVVIAIAVFMGAFHCKLCQNGENVTNMFGQDGGERRRFIFGRRRRRSGSVRQTDSLVLQTLSIIKNLGLIEK